MYVGHEVFIKVTLFQEICSAPNNSRLCGCKHYTRLAQNRFPEKKMLVNFMMETARTEVTSIRRRNYIEKSTWRTHQCFVPFDSRIHVESSTSNQCRNFHVDLPFKIDENSTNFPRGISTSKQWQIDEDVSTGKKMFGRNQLKSLKYKNFF